MNYFYAATLPKTPYGVAVKSFITSILIRANLGDHLSAVRQVMRSIECISFQPSQFLANFA